MFTFIGIVNIDTNTKTGGLTNHFRAERVVITNNTFVNNVNGIEIGFSNNGNYNKPLLNVTITNNIITSSMNSLVTIMDGKDQGSAITWSNNIMYPTGSATTLAGGTITTSFSTSQAVNENPFLAVDASTSTANNNNWKATVATPSYNNATYANVTQISPIITDIDGQIRPSPNRNPGADQYDIINPVLNPPMTESTVGPFAYETSLSVKNNEFNNLILIYPIPSKNNLTIKSTSSSIAKIVIYAMDGRKVLEKNTKITSSFNLDTSSLMNGNYILTVFDNSLKSVMSKHIIIAH
ncbi:T9SS type A sorting domain-containing protein [Kaistella flava (ex Peng et al. 2021)]|uniref:T9SS type A sorting domain-containing protein n=1 Tax=Kaistella flava (ex Peng et al. 2021) TaxID=2038776 RepID=A0A7M2Y9B1_9FLAO|nr:T9SS type A sorting domain-containing protein [Kaistella flava (ex Peng et al. 2021)]QOW10419.1 T9SS type A sorting domain-containing protein [Kaistella flava (ex Peng et al. 2021)]